MKSLFLLLIVLLVSPEISQRNAEAYFSNMSSATLNMNQNNMDEQQFYFSNPDSIPIKNKEDEAAKSRIKNSFEELYHILNPFD